MLAAGAPACHVGANPISPIAMFDGNA